jgi:hypothetical protein
MMKGGRGPAGSGLPLTLDGRGGGDSVWQEQAWEGRHGRSTGGREPASVGGGERLWW